MNYNLRNIKIEEEEEIDDVEPEENNNINKWQHFSEHQKSILMEAFSQNPWPEIKIKQNLAEQLGIKVKGVSSWFERTRFKKGIKLKPTQFPKFPVNLRQRNVPKEFKGVNLHLLESIHVQENFPDAEWIRKIAEFTESSFDQVSKWFIQRNKEK